MTKAKKGAAKAAAEPERKTFVLDEHRAESYRAALYAPPVEGEPDPIATFWYRMAPEMGFLPADIEVDGPVADDGPITFTAVPADAPQAGEALATDVAAAADVEEAGGVDSETEQLTALDRMSKAVDVFDFGAGSLLGDITDAFLEVVKRLPKPWDAHSQHEKRDLVAKLEEMARTIIKGAVDVVAAEDRVSVRALVEKIDVGDKVTVKLKLAAMAEDEMSDAIQQLYHCHKKSVLIVTADPTMHMGKRREAVPPDEEELPFDAGNDAPAPEIDEEAMYVAAREMVIRERKASVSWLQRQLRTGYNRAARTMDRLEKEGVVSQPDATGARDVLAPVPDDSDLAGGEAAPEEPAGEDELFGVFDGQRSEWLIDEEGGEDGWTSSVADAGRWPHGKATDLARGLEGDGEPLKVRLLDQVDAA